MIYVIKLFRIKDENSMKNFDYTSESVGYYEHKEAAIESVETNLLDLSDDGYFNFSCVMAFEEGVYSIQEEEKWFKWNREKKQYEACEGRPKEFEGFAFFI